MKASKSKEASDIAAYTAMYLTILPSLSSVHHLSQHSVFVSVSAQLSQGSSFLREKAKKHEYIPAEEMNAKAVIALTDESQYR